ncbi:hypothetical protein CONLIGDRAFT_646510 [Coniochaeta ligniaria NRRL 30616]|uniref:Uncharacterized protein n=1 Tax=Coniochaeta ligniaria NRRL 30616 TaxID=1408157 RepID=A0A1J7IFZ3_9PEZI|nr:hypothetical protein CONLIGDRAFT_646510 [Coniochaeta ligniaria NRRL 30616]
MNPRVKDPSSAGNTCTTSKTSKLRKTYSSDTAMASPRFEGIIEQMEEQVKDMLRRRERLQQRLDAYASLDSSVTSVSARARLKSEADLWGIEQQISTREAERRAAMLSSPPSRVPKAPETMPQTPCPAKLAAAPANAGTPQYAVENADGNASLDSSRTKARKQAPRMPELLRLAMEESNERRRLRLAASRKSLPVPEEAESTQHTPCPAPSGPAPGPTKVPQHAAEKADAKPTTSNTTSTSSPDQAETLLSAGEGDDGSFEEVDSPEDDDYEHVVVPAKGFLELVHRMALLGEDYETVDECERWNDCGGEYDTIPEEYDLCKAAGKTPV